MKSRVLLLDVDALDALDGDVDRGVVPGDEGDVRDGQLAADEPAPGGLREHAVEHAEDAQDLLLVPLDRARHLLGVEADEPERLAEVRAIRAMRGLVSISVSCRNPGLRDARRETRDAPLAGRLEEEPLDEVVALLLVRDGDALLGVVLVDEVEDDRVGLPEREVAVVVVHERGDAPVRVEIRERRLLVLARGEVEVDGLVGQPELFEHEGDFPEIRERESQYRIIGVR